MANIPERDKLEIKMMAEYLYDIDPVVYKWTQKFLAKDYLELKEDIGPVSFIVDIKSLWIS